MPATPVPPERARVLICRKAACAGASYGVVMRDIVVLFVVMLAASAIVAWLLVKLLSLD